MNDCGNIPFDDKFDCCGNTNRPGIEMIYYCTESGNVYDELGNFLGIAEFEGESIKRIIPGQKKESKLNAYLINKNIET